VKTKEEREKLALIAFNNLQSQSVMRPSEALNSEGEHIWDPTVQTIVVTQLDSSRECELSTGKTSRVSSSRKKG